MTATWHASAFSQLKIRKGKTPMRLDDTQRLDLP
jgi:hypothetical protein